MKSAEEIKKGLEICATGLSEICEQCPYTGKGCDIKLTKDALEHIEILKRSERFFAERVYDVDDCCKFCANNAECNDPQKWEETDEDDIPDVSKEKCIEGMLAYVHAAEAKHEEA